MNKYWIIVIICFLSIGATAQSDKLDRIKQELDSLAMGEAPGLNGNVNFSIVGAPLQDLLRGVAETHNLNINIGAIPNINVTNNFNDVKAKDLLYFLCKEYDLNIEFVNSIMSFTYDDPNLGIARPRKELGLDYENGLLTLDLQNDSLARLAKELTQLTGTNVIVGPAVQGFMVSGYVQDLPVKEALEQIAFANSLQLTVNDENVLAFIGAPTTQPNQNVAGNNTGRNRRRSRGNGGGYEFSNINPQTGRFDLNTQGGAVTDMIKDISQRLNVSHVLLTEPQGFLNCYLKGISYEEFLSLALSTTNHGYLLDNGIYLIGEGQNASMNQSKVYLFKNRSVEKISEVIPQVITNGLTITEFNDLNALIITGSDLNINRLVDFLDQIDQRVANVLIEVIVADIRKGHSIRTGITAGLADSVPASGGSVFPGVDMTFSSASVNRFLNNLDRKGVINLGRVTPQFYASVQALEDNNQLEVKSTPKLSTLNGSEANLKIGQSVYYLIETQNVTGGVNPIVTRSPRYEKVEANLDLKITPFVSGNEDVTLTLEAEFSDFIDPTTEGAPPGNSTRQFLSKIRIKNEEMIVLGGLEEARRSESASGFPILSRIPVIKWLFSSRSKDKSDSKLLVFIKPTIVY
ncbi:MAG: hypothetical protein NXI20_07190 [bacterium]|nr:hypothetical protein [bacterium]